MRLSGGDLGGANLEFSRGLDVGTIVTPPSSNRRFYFRSTPITLQGPVPDMISLTVN